MSKHRIQQKMPFTIKAFKTRVARFRALLSFFLVAMAQFMSPAAAADPSSKIDPPAWSYRHSRQEMQAYGARPSAQEPEKQNRQSITRARLRRILMQPSSKTD